MMRHLTENSNGAKSSRGPANAIFHPIRLSIEIEYDLYMIAMPSEIQTARRPQEPPPRSQIAAIGTAYA
jgi:hypothetical protein